MANQNYKDCRIIALERAEETEVICEKCKIGIMRQHDSKHLKCSNCGEFIEEKNHGNK